MKKNFRTDELYGLQVREFELYAMFIIGTDGMLATWNVGVERLFGYSEKDWLGKPAAMIFTPPEQAQAVCEAEMQTAREQGSATDIRWHLKKDKTEFFAHGFLKVLRGDDGEEIGFAKIVHDETARKQLEDSLTASNSALEQFAYVASHDLQEPLRTMNAFSELLRRDYADKLDSDAEKYLSFIMSAAVRMQTLVSDLLEYARNATELERPASVALDEDIETALSQLSQSIAESNAVVTHDALPCLPVDRGRMIRLFQNLLGNSLKYRKPHEAPVVHVSAELRDNEWVFSVRDNGIGFEQRHATAIFAPFKRLHGPQEYAGTGIGLSICNRIVVAHGGRMWAESEPGKGATFYFSLPAASLDAPAKEA